jgi:cyanobactin maturation PatA/PatG family protease
MIGAAVHEYDVPAPARKTPGLAGPGSPVDDDDAGRALPPSEVARDLKLANELPQELALQVGQNSQPGGLQSLLSALADVAPGDRSVKIGIIEGCRISLIRRCKTRQSKSSTPWCRPGTGRPTRTAQESAASSSAPATQFAASRQDARASSCRSFSVRPVSQLDLARAITFGLEQGVSIINVSAGQRVVAPDAHDVLGQVLDRCAERRVLVVAAAGNDGCACLHVPAAIPSVLAVGAVDDSGRPLVASNWGATYRENGILAPGDGLTVATLAGGIGTASGTSYATALVSGAAALLLSLARREGYRVDAGDIREILIESAAPCTLEGDGACDRFLAGTLDAGAAVAALRQLGKVRQSNVSMPPEAALDRSISADHFQQNARRENIMTDATPIPKDAASAAGVMPPPEAVPASESLLQSETPPMSPSAAAPPPARSSAADLAQLRSQPSDRLSQQSCACGGGGPVQLIYVLGALWFDFGSEARRDAFVQKMGAQVEQLTDVQIIHYLDEHPEEALGLTFVLRHGDTPIYAVQPVGPFADKTYKAMFGALTSSLDEEGSEQRVSIPGIIGGSTRLWNGMTVPVVYPDLRGMYKWRSSTLIQRVRAAKGTPGQSASDQDLKDFLDKVYYELRNLGVAPQDRALNYAATNAYQAAHALADAASKSLVLDSINVVKSPICRPDSDCWDVQLVMFDDDDLRKPNRVYRFTVDVSDVIPVTVGRPRNWAMRPS